VESCRAKNRWGVAQAASTKRMAAAALTENRSLAAALGASQLGVSAVARPAITRSLVPVASAQLHLPWKATASAKPPTSSHESPGTQKRLPPSVGATPVTFAQDLPESEAQTIALVDRIESWQSGHGADKFRFGFKGILLRL